MDAWERISLKFPVEIQGLLLTAQTKPLQVRIQQEVTPGKNATFMNFTQLYEKQ